MGKVKRIDKNEVRFCNTYDWQCVECGLIWIRRIDAQNCEKRGHIAKVLQHFSDDIKVGRRG